MGKIGDIVERWKRKEAERIGELWGEVELEK